MSLAAVSWPSRVMPRSSQRSSNRSRMAAVSNESRSAVPLHDIQSQPRGNGVQRMVGLCRIEMGGKQQGIYDRLIEAHRAFSRAMQKRDIEGRVVSDQHSVRGEQMECRQDHGEWRLVAHHLVSDAVETNRSLGNRSARID